MKNEEIILKLTEIKNASELLNHSEENVVELLANYIQAKREINAISGRKIKAKCKTELGEMKYDEFESIKNSNMENVMSQISSFKSFRREFVFVLEYCISLLCNSRGLI